MYSLYRAWLSMGPPSSSTTPLSSNIVTPLSPVQPPVVHAQHFLANTNNNASGGAGSSTSTIGGPLDLTTTMMSFHQHYNQQQSQQQQQTQQQLMITSPPDVQLQVGPSLTTFSAHRNVLIAHSGFFKAALSSLASINGPITVTNINVDEFSSLLTFMYTGLLDLNAGNIYNILLATHILHMPRALEICRTFLINHHHHQQQEHHHHQQQQQQQQEHHQQQQLENHQQNFLLSNNTLENSTITATDLMIRNNITSGVIKPIPNRQRTALIIPNDNDRKNEENDDFDNNENEENNEENSETVRKVRFSGPALGFFALNPSTQSMFKRYATHQRNSMINDAKTKENNESASTVSMETSANRDLSMNNNKNSKKSIDKDTKSVIVEKQIKKQKVKATKIKTDKPNETPMTLKSSTSTSHGNNSHGNHGNQGNNNKTNDFKNANNTLNTGRTTNTENNNNKGGDNKVIVDIACCDGPVRFHRVINKSYGQNNILTNHSQQLTKSLQSSSLSTTTSSSLPMETISMDKPNRLDADAMNKAMSANIKRGESQKGANIENGTNNEEQQGQQQLMELYTCLYCNHTFKSQYCFQKHARRHLNPAVLEINHLKSKISTVGKADYTNSGAKNFVQNVVQCGSNLDANGKCGGAGQQQQNQLINQQNHGINQQNVQINQQNLQINQQNLQQQQREVKQQREVRLLDMNVQYYPCKTCGSKFPSYYFVHKHRKLCHPEEMPNNNNNASSTITSTITTSSNDVKGNTNEILTNTDEILTNTDGILKNTKEFTRNTKEFARNTKEFTRNTEEIVRNTDKIVRNTDEIATNSKITTTTTNQTSTTSKIATSSCVSIIDMISTGENNTDIEPMDTTNLKVYEDNEMVDELNNDHHQNNHNQKNQVSTSSNDIEMMCETKKVCIIDDDDEHRMQQNDDFDDCDTNSKHSINSINSINSIIDVVANE